MDISVETDEDAQAESPPDENVQIVQVMAPYQFGAVKPPQVQAGPNCPVVILISQGGWAVQAPFAQNDALELARRIKQAVKAARSGLAIAQTPLLGANGEPISVPIADDDEEDEQAVAG